jgi:hypothetical protein
MELLIHAILTSALDGCEWSASRPGRFNSGERTFSKHWIGGWVGPKGGLDTVEKICDVRKFWWPPSFEIVPYLINSFSISTGNLSL